VPLIKILTLYALVKIIGVTLPQIIKSVGKPEYLFQYNLIRIVILLPALFIASRWDVHTVAITMVTVLWLFKPLEIYMLKKTIGITIKQYLDTFIVPLGSSLIMCAVIVVVKNITDSFSGIITLTLSIIVAVVTYVVAMMTIDAEGIQRFKEFMRAYIQ